MIICFNFYSFSGPITWALKRRKIFKSKIRNSPMKNSNQSWWRPPIIKKMPQRTILFLTQSNQTSRRIKIYITIRMGLISLEKTKTIIFFCIFLNNLISATSLERKPQVIDSTSNTENIHTHKTW